MSFRLGGAECYEALYDLDDDGDIDIVDIMLVAAHWGETCPTPTPTPIPTATPPPPTSLDVTLVVTYTLNASRTDEPVTSGVPIPRSVNLIRLSLLRLLDGTGQPIPAQFTPLARWGGSGGLTTGGPPHDVSKPVHWLLLDFQTDVPANGAATYRLVDSGGATPTFPTLNVTDGADAVTADTGMATFGISKSDGRLSAPTVRLSSRRSLAAPLFGRAVDSGGEIYTTSGPVTVTVALSGPMRVSVHVQGAYRDAGGKTLLDYTSRYWFYAGQPTVRLFHTVENNNLCPLAEHEQLDCYDIGSGRSVTITDLSLVVPTSLSESLSYQAGGEGTPVGGALTDDLLLYQDSSGTEHWDHYPTMTDGEGNPLDTRPQMQSYVTFRRYRTTLGAPLPAPGGHLVSSGPFGLFQMARAEYGYQELPQGYAGKCHLCVDVRRCLHQRGEFAELRPGGFYEDALLARGILQERT